LIPRKLTGSLTKLPRPKGYLLIWPSDLDRTVRAHFSSDGPIRTAWFGRSDLVGRAGTAGLHGGARRRVHVCAVLGTGAVANGRVRVRSTQAR
jgi:hypothetical protein